MDWSDKTAEDFLDAAHTITPSILREREKIERNQKLSAEILDEMRRQGFFSLALPKTYGGPELTPAGLCRVVEVLSAADGSVGWCAGIASATSRLAAYLPEAVAKRVFGKGGITAGTLAPTGIAIASKWASIYWEMVMGERHSS